QQVFPANLAPHVETVAARQVVDVNFGVQRTGSVSGVKFSDLDSNGVQDPGEPGLPGFVIQAFDLSGNLAGQTVTRADGSYVLELLPGDYTIVEVQQPGYIQTSPQGSQFLVAGFDFESGAQGFTITDGSRERNAEPQQWHLSDGRAFDQGHSPTTSFYFGAGESVAGGGQYDLEAFGAILSPLIALPAGADVRLEFSHFLDIEDFFDFVNVNILVGGFRTEVASDDDFGTVTFDPATGTLRRSTSGFETFSVDISQFAGQQIQIEFEFFSDELFTFEGWYIDDVNVIATVNGYLVPVVAEQDLPGFDFGNFDQDEFPNDIAGAAAAAPLPVVADQTLDLVTRIDRPGEVDVFQIVAPQDGFLAVQMTAIDFFDVDPFLRLFDAGGNLLRTDDDSGGFFDSLLVVPVTAGETFFVEASSLAFFGNAFGTYELSVTSTGTAQDLVLSQTAPGQFSAAASGNLAQVDQVQVFRIDVPVDLPAGSFLTLDVQPGALSNLVPVLAVFDEGLNLLEQDGLFFVDNSFQERVFGGETFFVAVFGADGTTGRFDLTATIGQLADDFPNDVFAPFNLGQVVPGTPLVQTGTIEVAFDVDTFLIEAPAGQTGVLTIDLQSTGAAFFDPVLEVRNPVTGALIAFNDDVDLFNFNFNSQVTLPVAGSEQFVIVARGFSDSRGQYTLTVNFAEVDDDFGNTIADAHPLGAVGVDFDLDAPVVLFSTPDRTGTIDAPFDVDFFQVEIPVAGTLQIRQNAVEGGSLDPFLRVFDPAGTLLAANDDVGFQQVGGEFTFSLNSLVSVQVSAGDTIFVQAGAFSSSTGDYQLVFSLGDDFPNDLPNASPFNLAAGIERGAIETAGDNDVFRFTATADERLRIQAVGTNTFSSSDVPQEILSNETITSPLFVDGLSGQITGVDVTLDISHLFVEDLDLVLISPTGTRIELALGSSLDIFGTNLTRTTFDQDSGVSITSAFPPYSGSFRPVGSLADLGSPETPGENPNGTWTLEIADTFFLDDGILNSWSITLATTTDPPPAGFNPLLTVFQEFDAGKFREVGRNGSLDGTSSQIDLFVQQGDQYIVRVSEIGTDVGTYQLSITPLAAGPDLGNTFADAELIFDPTLPNLGLDPDLFEITPGDVDMVRFVARNTGQATFSAAPLSGDLDPRLSVFEFVADPRSAGNQLPQQIASGGQSVTFAVTAGQEYVVRISGDATSSGQYDPQLSFPASVVDGVLDGGFDSQQAGNLVFDGVRQALLSLSQPDGDRVQLAEDLINQAITTFRSAPGFDPTGTFLVLVLDPVDGTLAEQTSGNEVGFVGGQGQFNEIGGSFFSGDGVVEVLIVPTADRTFNLNLSGLGALPLFGARLITPDSPGGMIATVTTSGGGSFSAGQTFSQSLFGTLNLVLDFTGGGDGGGGTDLGLGVALSGQSGQASGFGFGTDGGVNSSTLALSAEAAEAIAQLRQRLFGGDTPEPPVGAWDRFWQEMERAFTGASQHVRDVLASVDDWIDDTVGVQDALAEAWEVLPEEADLLWQKREWLWSSLGRRSPLASMKLFFRMHEAVERFAPLLHAPPAAEPAGEAPAGDSPDAGEAALQPSERPQEIVVTAGDPAAARESQPDAASDDELVPAAAVSDDVPAPRLLRARPRLARLYR
ncbi:MAG TPA: proprotein convertase P-domain-containing protein, partial [Planctomycetaceae bacterium]|nr:proprotein convertase P-domain-containing protein [Planctomycetaceae bacterium]